ncbi:MAG: protein kinase [Planctomycetaceae bacterium]|nr:protein kinase [Planctomycetaceae bacterium]
MSRTTMFLKKRLWIWPIIAVVVLLAVGFLVQRSIATTMRDNLKADLETLLSVEKEMLLNWYGVQESNALSLGTDEEVRDAILALVEAQQPNQTVEQTTLLELQGKIEKALGPGLAAHDFYGYVIANRKDQIIASSYPELIGKQDLADYEQMLNRVLDGDTLVTPPFASVAAIKDQDGQQRTGVPTMYVVTPIRDQSFQIIAALALQIRPDREFTRILQLGRSGESGETYAFNREAVMVSNSRFDEDLILLGLLPDRENSRSILNILIHDPGGNMTEGFRPMIRRNELPMTKMVASATQGETSCSVDGYNDYRGVPVVGAWTWLDKYGVGVATEVDVAEAFRPLHILQRVFGAVFSLLILSSVAIFIFTLIVSRLQRAARKATIEAKQLGQYQLKTKLGAGAMGTVYRGEHAMLQRPTAIKLLNVDKVTEETIKRFEREVQITCQLNNPHTIAIYDYGRTPDNIFYYAMEYLDGMDLQDLVTNYGPIDEARAIFILLQICESLHEAHSLGLVHRDVKPANIMINNRGGVPDLVKVLDFGLVKALDEKKEAALTTNNSLTGTPLYISPEGIQNPNLVDARSDLYAVGAIGYFLVTGQPVFEASTLMELCQHHIAKDPPPLKDRTTQQLSEEFELALRTCLAKERNKRPQTARDLIDLLMASPSNQSWTFKSAERWWNQLESGQLKQASAEAETKNSAHERTIIE